MPNNVVLIPLRGGSKGIPNKNINNLSGKPLCKWSIEAALGVKNIDKVYVSTESRVIKDLILSFNLGVAYFSNYSLIHLDNLVAKR